MDPKVRQALANQVGSQFVRYYYFLFDTQRGQLQNLYDSKSLVYWDGQVCGGRENISSALTYLPYNKIEHVLTTDDHQMTPDDCVLSMVIGQLKLDQKRPMNFHETFLLKKVGDAWMVMNQTFRIAS